MKLSELAVLLPCHGLEDFPQYYEGEAADGLLSAWSALWHPALVAAAGKVPAWHRIDSPPADLTGRILVVPPVCRDQLPADLVEQARQQSATLIDDCTSRPELVMRLLNAGGFREDPGDRLAADFLALGYCRLQVELLMRQMRYSSHIDELQFNAEVVAAASAWAEGDQASSRNHLTNAYELLYEARKYYYPVDAYLIDLTLVAPTTIGASLRAELAQSAPVNLVVCADHLALVAQQEPESLSMLRQAIADKTAGLVGGERTCGPLPLLPLENIFEEFASGLRQYEELVGTRPLTFGRWRFGLTPLLPQILTKFAFIGAVHFTLDDGQFPLGSQAKIRWEGNDSSAMDALGRLARDALQPETFLGFSRRIGDSMDTDHVATVAFAHWPDHTSPWYQDLRRIAELSPVLGKFVTLEDYFTQTEQPGRMSKFKADEYRAPYLRQAVAAGDATPISAFVEVYNARAQEDALIAVTAMRQLIAPAGDPLIAAEGEAREHQTGLNASSHEVNRQRLRDAASQLARAVAPSPAGAEAELLVVNPLSFSRKLTVELREVGLADPNDDTAASVEVPAMGFAWAPASPAASKGKRPKPIAIDIMLRNQHMEVLISRETGGIEAIHAYPGRGNRISQQLALRLANDRPEAGHVWRDPDQDASYSTMRAEAIEVSSHSTFRGEITSRGVLIGADEQPLARFRQQVQLDYSSQVLKLHVDIEPLEMPGADPWLSYYAARFAWSDPQAQLARNVGLGLEPTEAKRIEAAQVIQIESGRARTAILTGGLAYHRRVSPRMLDSLLMVRGETARRFTIGLGLDLPNPVAGALDAFAPPVCVLAPRPTAGPHSGWLFHIDARNVVATHWESLAVDDPKTLTTGVGAGFRVRLAETAGLAGPVTLRAFRPVRSAQLVDFQGQTLLDLEAEDDKIRLDIAAYEWIELEARWA